MQFLKCWNNKLRFGEEISLQTRSCRKNKKNKKRKNMENSNLHWKFVFSSTTAQTHCKLGADLVLSGISSFSGGLFSHFLIVNFGTLNFYSHLMNPFGIKFCMPLRRREIESGVEVSLKSFLLIKPRHISSRHQNCLVCLMKSTAHIQVDYNEQVAIEPLTLKIRQPAFGIEIKISNKNFSHLHHNPLAVHSVSCPELN